MRHCALIVQVLHVRTDRANIYPCALIIQVHHMRTDPAISILVLWSYKYIIWELIQQYLSLIVQVHHARTGPAKSIITYKVSLRSKVMSQQKPSHCTHHRIISMFYLRPLSLLGYLTYFIPSYTIHQWWCLKAGLFKLAVEIKWSLKPTCYRHFGNQPIS